MRDREKRLTEYQNVRYAKRYRKLVTRIAEHEKAVTPGQTGIAVNAAKYLYKLMACKDEYEVARLLSNGKLQSAIEAQFEGDYTVHYHLAPPLVARKDKVTGLAQKREFGPGTQRLFRSLARLKFLRRTVADVFSYTQERRTEKAVLKEYEDTLSLIHI